MIDEALILSEGHTASTDYFLLPYLNALGYSINLIDTRYLPNHFGFKDNLKLIVISRYISQAWLNRLKNRSQDCKLVYFIDDDLWDLTALNHLPWLYRWKIYSKAFRYRTQLQNSGAELWVSTAYLANKYQQFKPKLITPNYSAYSIQQTPVHICYHGTGSHQREIQWLFAIITEIQSQLPYTYFELFGHRYLHSQWSALPRVSILYPMNWTNYLAFTATQQRQIALAPLLPSPFNAARGITKFYDYARMQAVGIYSNVEPYRSFIRHNIDGFLIDNQIQDWIESILLLATNSLKRQQMLAAILQRIHN
ncbi:MAG: hypothetical protein RL637_1290 [Pseudomonadota bacterium]|jgi:hypothetical protein